ncbi:glycosyltransferase family 2 protein [Altericista sp. CCNU0014]|uniref:glycosyltransferase family 2 protein n=1 Tax=Altericista sp. CCNU0014 TaxID=3082949 RepID=UPI00384F8CD9
MSDLLVSVIVCTYNRAQLLKQCLDSLVVQSADRNQFEVAIVDNNSTDNTFEISQQYIAKEPHFRYVTATKQGLSCARNVGWQTALGRYIAYIDDDAIAAPDWLEIALEFIAAHPEIKAFGGPYDAYTQTQPPDWFPPEYGRLSFGNTTHPIRLVEEWIPGSNMVFSRDLFDRCGGFDERLGMSGTQTAYMEEIDFLLRLQASGVEIFYVHNLKVSHLIADYKMHLKWLLRSTYSEGRSARKTFMKERCWYSHSAAILKTFFAIFVKFLVPRKLPLQRRIYYALQWFAWELGAFREYFQERWPWCSRAVK